MARIPPPFTEENAPDICQARQICEVWNDVITPLKTTFMKTIFTRFLPGLAVLFFVSTSAMAYTVSYTDGGQWSTVYVQGFSTSLGATPSPSLSNGDPVDLTQFQFYKSGTADSASSIYLAIFSTMYPDTTTLSTNNATFVGLSANMIPSTTSIATGDPINFNFDNLELSYGNDYSAIFVNVGSDGSLTPVLVSALTANYYDAGAGDYHPVTNYGTESQYQYTTSNFINGGYFQSFSYAGDANFLANLQPVPEPTTSAVIGAGFLLFALKRVRSRV